MYDASGNLITQINNSVGFKNIKGEEWFQIKESVATAGYGEEIDGLLDLSAQYEDGRNVVLEAITGDLVLKMKNSFRLVGMKALTGGNTVMFNPYSTFTGYASSSSSRYKVIGNPVKEKDIEDLYDIKVVWAKYKDEYLSEKDERYGKEMPMFLAEDIDNKFSIAADHDDQGRAENWNYRIMIPCMFAMLKNDHEKISSLQSEMENLKFELQELKKLILKGE